MVCSQSGTAVRSRRQLRFGWALLAIGAAGLSVRFAYIAVVAPGIRPGLDSIWYSLVGKSLATRHLYSEPVPLLYGINRPTAAFPPGYPVFVGVLYRLGVTTRTGLEVVGAFCGIAVVAMTGLVGRRISGQPVVGLVAAGVVAVCPALIAADGAVMSETVAVPLSLGVVLAMSWAASARSLWRWGVVGALAGLAVLVRSEAIVLAVLLIPAAVMAANRDAVRRRAAQCGVALLAAGVVVAPWVVRNLVVFNPPVVLSSNGDPTLAGANCPATYYGSEIGSWEYNCTDSPLRAELGEARYAQTLRHRATQYIGDHLSRVPVVVVVRVLRTWGLYNPAQQVRIEAIESRDPTWGWLSWVGALVLLVLAVPGLAAMRHDHFGLVLLAGPVLLVSLVVAVTRGSQRSVLTAMPELAIAAAVSVAGFVKRHPSLISAT